MRYALLLLLVSTAAHADVQTLRKVAEQHERDAHLTKDLRKYVACGTAYLDIHSKFPGPHSDEMLYNAAVCFHEGKSIGAALQAFELIRRDFPASKVAPRALARTAHIYAMILQLDRAAERLEEYAKKYAGEKDALAAMSDAVLYRRALGDRKRTIENTRFFVKTFGQKRAAEAAQAMVSLTSAYDDDPDKQLQHLQMTARMNRLDLDQQAFVWTKIGDLLSAKSCPVRLQEGLCIKYERRAPASCTTEMVRTVKRTAAAHKDALAAYTTAARLFVNTAPGSSGHYYAAHAKLALVDAALERLLQRPAPSGKLDRWLDEATAHAKPVHDAYEAMVGLREPHAAIVAAGRLGQTVEAVWRTLGQTKDCAAVESLAAPLAQRAGDLFGVCLAKAAQLGVHDAYTRMCLREGLVVDPKRFARRDVHPDPSAIAIALVPDKIGAADHRAGRRAVAIKAWEAALAKDAKLFAPRINLAIARHEERSPGDRKALADITHHAQSALAIEYHPAALVLLAALALEDKTKEDFAKFVLDDALRVDEKYAAAHVGLGIIAGRREQWPLAISHFERAAELEPSDANVLALALAYLRVGRDDAAAAKLVAIKRATYDVELARGVAARGLGKTADAKAAYERAIKLDATRPEAAQNLRAP